MKTNMLLIALLIVSWGISLNAQDYAFKVLVNKGKNEVKAGEAWQPIKTGASLKSDDEVRLVDNSYLGLIHATGKPLELKQAGKYKVVELSAKISGGTSVLNKYTDFILSSNTEKKGKLAATGAVHRGANSTKVFLPPSELAVVYGDKVILDWGKEAQVTTYVINLKSMFGDDLYSTETKDNTITINLDDAKFKNEDNIIIEVYPKGVEEKKPDPAYMLKKLSPADKQRIRNSLDEVSKQLPDESALSKLVLAGFFEQNKLLVDATTAYLEAIKLAPDVPDYQVAYQNFLIRNGIKEEKK